MKHCLSKEDVVKIFLEHSPRRELPRWVETAIDELVEAQERKADQVFWEDYVTG